MLVEGISDSIGKKAETLLTALKKEGKLQNGPPAGGRPNDLPEAD
jgi:hypothetical protein